MTPKQWMFDPNSGGMRIPPAVQVDVEKRVHDGWGVLEQSCDVTDPKPKRGIGSFDLKPRLMYNEIGHGQNILELESR